MKRGRLLVNGVLGIGVGAGLVGAISLLGADTAATATPRTVTASRGVVLASVSAAGNISSPRELAVNFQTSGTLAEVVVKPGDRVKKGQVLATLDAAASRTEVETARANLASAEASLAKTLAGLSSAERRQNAVSESQAVLQLDQAKASLRNERRVLAVEERSARVELAQAVAALGAARKKLVSYDADVSEAETGVETTQSAYDSATTRVATAQSAYDKASAALAEAKRVQAAHSLEKSLHDQNHQMTDSRDSGRVYLDYKEAQQDLKIQAADAQAVSDASDVTTAASTALSESKSDQSTAKSELTTAQNELDTARDHVATQQDTVTTASRQVQTQKVSLESTLTRARQTLKSSTDAVQTASAAVRSTRASNAVKDASPTTAAIAADQASVAQARATLETAMTALAQTRLTAPVSGTVATINQGVGETVSTGSTTSGESSTSFLTLVDLEGLQVAVGFSEVDAAKIRVAQTATISVDALPEVKFAGRVVSVDTLSTVTSNVVTYTVTVALDNPTSKVKPGMSADVDVVTAEAKGAVNVPTSAITNTGRGATLTVLRDGQNVVVDVVTGVEGDSTTQIVTGLSAGETVVLPTATVAVSNGAGLPAGFPPSGFRVGGG